MLGFKTAHHNNAYSSLSCSCLINSENWTNHKGVRNVFLALKFCGILHCSSCDQLKSIIHATLATLDCYSNKNKVPLQIQLKVKAYVISLWCFQYITYWKALSLSFLQFRWNLKIIVIIENHEIYRVCNFCLSFSLGCF